MLSLEVCPARPARPIDLVATTFHYGCEHLTMALSTDSIIAILGVLVALPPALLIVLTAVRRKRSPSTHHSRLRHQYSFFPGNTYPRRVSNIQGIHFHPPSHASSRHIAYFHLQRTSPVALDPRPPPTAQALIQAPPPTYQPMHLHPTISTDS